MLVDEWIDAVRLSDVEALRAAKTWEISASARSAPVTRAA